MTVPLIGYTWRRMYLICVQLQDQYHYTKRFTCSMQNGSRNCHSIIMKHAPPPGPASATPAPRLYGDSIWLIVTMITTATVHKKLSMARVVRFRRKKPNLSCLTVVSRFGVAASRWRSEGISVYASVRHRTKSKK